MHAVGLLLGAGGLLLGAVPALAWELCGRTALLC